MDISTFPTLTTTVVFLGLIAAYALFRASKSGQNRHFPPGPKPLPFFGNMFDIPIYNAARIYVEWESKYNSKILFASAFGEHLLVLNKREDAVELLENRSHKYSDRTSLPVVDMMGWSGNVGMMRYGNFWRLHKKICNQNFRQEASPQYNPIIAEKVRSLLRNLLEHPDEFERHSKLLSVSVPLATMYGYDVQAVDDPCVKAADQSNLLASRLLLPGVSFVNAFPVLRHIPPWFPGAFTAKTAKRAKELTQEVIRVPMDNLKQRMADGPVPPSLVSTFLEKKEIAKTSEEEETVIRNVAYTVYGGASDTTNATTLTFLYLIATHPDIQRKAQEELDRVLGPSHMPTFEDRKSLPYTDAIYREVLRWRPPLPTCVPHVTTEDDYYKGYYIPKGTTVLANIWAMSHDDELYENPSAFMPERHIDENGRLKYNERILAYGFGRRMCVGKHVASSIMWLIIASTLAAFKIDAAKDRDGNEIPVDSDYTVVGLIDHKSPFKISITPRSDKIKDILSD